MNIVQLVLAETGTYDPMLLRPYECFDNRRNLEVLQQVTEYGRNLTPEAMSGSVGGLLRPSANPHGQIEIAHGWGTKRYRFFMHIVLPDMAGMPQEQYITGYTDYDGGNYGTGSIDPNLRMYVTNTIRMRSLSYNTEFGRQNQISIGSASHVFNQKFYPGMENATLHNINLQRPMDVFATLQTADMRRFGSSGDFLDPRTTFAQENVKLSNRKNSLAPEYLSKILRAGGASYVNSSEEDDQSEIWGRAEGMVREEVYGQDEALFTLHRRTSFSDGDSFTYSELIDLCPHLDSVTKLVPQVAAMQLQQNSNLPVLEAYSAGTFDGWNGQDTNTVWATILSNSLPPLMLDSMIANVGFNIHNHTLNNEPQITWFYVQPFARNMEAMVSQQLVDNFGYMLQTKVIRDLLAGSKAPFSITGHVDVLGESRFEISIAGAHAVPFATPTFADALFAPVMTRGNQGVQTLSGQIQFFTENLMQSDTSHRPAAQPAPQIIMPPGANYNASSETL